MASSDTVVKMEISENNLELCSKLSNNVSCNLMIYAEDKNGVKVKQAQTLQTTNISSANSEKLHTGAIKQESQKDASCMSSPADQLAGPSQYNCDTDTDEYSDAEGQLKMCEKVVVKKNGRKKSSGNTKTVTDKKKKRRSNVGAETRRARIVQEKASPASVNREQGTNTDAVNWGSFRVNNINNANAVDERRRSTRVRKVIFETLTDDFDGEVDIDEGARFSVESEVPGGTRRKKLRNVKSCKLKENSSGAGSCGPNKNGEQMSLGSHDSEELVKNKKVKSGECKMCPVCGEVFSRSFTLTVHMLTHQREKDVNREEKSEQNLLGESPKLGAKPEVKKGKMCQVCGKTLARADTLKVHLRVHTGDRPFKCSQCGATYKVSSHLRNHVRSKHSDSMLFQCHKCGKDFSYATSRNRHQKVCGVDLSQRVQFHCQVCSKDFVTVKGFQKHMDKAACSSDPSGEKKRDRAKTIRDSQKTEADVKLEKDSFLYKCNKCHKKFEEAKGLDCHQRFLCGMLATGPFGCPECEKVYNKRYRYIVHARHHVGYRPFKCSQCEASFMERTTWRRHNASHRGPKEKTRCSLCDKMLAGKRALSIHTMRVHCGVKLFKCQECSKDFAGPRELSIHIRRTHRKERPYKCVLCFRAFFRSHAWMKHMVGHTRGKKTCYKPLGLGFTRTPPQYTCNVCHKLFTLQNMRVHVSTEHPGVPLSEAVSKQFLTCDLCHKEFSSKESLQVHKKRHSKEKDFQCQVCHKSFVTEAYLRCHQRKHTGDRPYQCPHCSKSFRWNASYVEHVKYMHGEDGSSPPQRFVCQHCGKSFKREDNLKCHVIRHRPVLPCVCNSCGKGFINKTCLRIHMSTHKGGDDVPRPFICESCGAGFFYSFLLKRHVATKHTTNQELCNICGKALCNKEVLKKHIALHLESPDGVIRKGRAAHAFKYGVGVIRTKQSKHKSSKEVPQTECKPRKKEAVEAGDELESQPCNRLFQQQFEKQVLAGHLQTLNMNTESSYTLAQSEDPASGTSFTNANTQVPTKGISTSPLTNTPSIHSNFSATVNAAPMGKFQSTQCHTDMGRFPSPHTDMGKFPSPHTDMQSQFQAPQIPAAPRNYPSGNFSALHRQKQFAEPSGDIAGNSPSQGDVKSSFGQGDGADVQYFGHRGLVHRNIASPVDSYTSKPSSPEGYLFAGASAYPVLAMRKYQEHFLSPSPSPAHHLPSASPFPAHSISSPSPFPAHNISSTATSHMSNHDLQNPSQGHHLSSPAYLPAHHLPSASPLPAHFSSCNPSPAHNFSGQSPVSAHNLSIPSLASARNFSSPNTSPGLHLPNTSHFAAHKLASPGPAAARYFEGQQSASPRWQHYGTSHAPSSGENLGSPPALPVAGSSMLNVQHRLAPESYFMHRMGADGYPVPVGKDEERVYAELTGRFGYYSHVHKDRPFLQ